MTAMAPTRRAKGRRALHLMLFFTLLAAAGCGKPTGNISGRVYFKDTPLTSGTVAFVTDQEAFRAFIKEDGSYEISKVPEGDVTITVTVNPQPNPAHKGGSSSKIVTIPAKYGDPKTSGQKYTVKAGDQQKDIKLD